MSIIKSVCRFTSRELDALLVMDKRVHHTLVYGITHVRNGGRKLVMKTSETLSRFSEE
ncbi:MAG: hypothetical protein GKC03_07595 [Methanomassiliicoccales archaeon]|jgi:hypothetical protein|nr:hypothetical protein [Methanomassiliicoccales archaeon]NYT16131.1 hypothetical protein [Methanomassiliicoccales archaeon]